MCIYLELSMPESFPAMDFVWGLEVAFWKVKGGKVKSESGIENYGA